MFVLRRLVARNTEKARRSDFWPHPDPCEARPLPRLAGAAAICGRLPPARLAQGVPFGCTRSLRDQVFGYDFSRFEGRFAIQRRQW